MCFKNHFFVLGQLFTVAYHTVKILAVKKFGKKAAAKDWEKGCCKGLAKKTLVANVNLHRKSPIIN